MDCESFVVDDWSRLALLLIVRPTVTCKLKLLPSRRRAVLPDRHARGSGGGLGGGRATRLDCTRFFLAVLFHVLLKPQSNYVDGVHIGKRGQGFKIPCLFHSSQNK